MYWHGLYLSTSNSILAVDINNQNNLTNHANVIFDAYFNDSGGNATHSIVADVNPEYPWLHINIGVTDGTLINPTIQVLALDGTTNANYELPFSNIRNNVQLVDPTNNKVVFSNISSTASSQSIFKYDLQISTELGGSIDVSKLNEDSKILFTAVYTDSAGNTTNISKEIYLNVGWTANLTMNLNQEVLRYVSHNESDGKYVLLQTTVTSKLDSDGKTNILPVKKSTIVIDVPTYQGIAPSKVEVEGVRTMNTNGKNAAYVEFDSSNWSYNSSTNQITITVNNPLSGNIATSRRGPDEFIISYTYPEAAYNLIDLSGVNIANKMSGAIELYSNTSTINVTESVNNNITLTGYVSGITGSIPKTILYINSLKKYSHPLVYHTQTYIRLLEETGDVYSQRMEIEQTHFFAGTTSFPSYIDGTNYVIIKDFFIPVSEFNTYLGPSGTIKIYTDDYTLVDTISSSTSTTTKNGQTGYYVTIPTSTARGTEKFILQTTRPLVANYTLNVYFDREIQSDMPYTIAQLQTFTHLDESGNVYHSYPADTTNYIYKTSARCTLGFKNTATDATLDVETNVLKSTADVQTLVFDIILDNSNTETDLWKEPVFDVELPEYITNANIVNVTMYNMPDLTFTSSDASILNSGGKLHFVLRAHDTQKGLYSDGKTIFKVELEVEVNKYTPTTTEDIVLHYYNELANIYLHPSTWTLDNSITDCGISTSSIAFVAEPKLYCVSKISNYDSEGSVVSSDSENNTGKIGLDSTEATMNLIVQNNHTVPASNIHILGRIPYINNKYVLLGTDLGTTINTKLTSTISQVSNIDADKITVYYSSNLNADTDLTNIANNWETNPANLSTIKSYMIVISDYELPVGEQIEFKYNFITDESIKYDKELYGNFGVYYSYEGIDGSAESEKVGLKTDTAPELRIVKESSVPEGNSVKEGDIITYTITVYNDGETDAHNVTIHDTVPEYTTYVEEENGEYVQKPEKTTITSETKETLAAGENFSTTFKVIVNKIEEENTIIRNTSKATADKMDDIPSNTIEIPARPTKPVLRVVKESSIPEGTKVKEGDIITYTITVYNDGNAPAHNVVIRDTVPEHTTYVEEENGEYVQKPEKTTITSEAKETLEAGENFSTTFKVIVNEIEEDTIIKNTAKATSDEIPETPSNTIEIPAKLTKPVLRVVKESSIPEGTKVKKGDIITYTITVYNDGNASAHNVVVQDKIPEHTTYVELVDGEYVQNTNIKTITSEAIEELKPGQKYTINFTVIVNEIKEENTIIKNTAKVTTDEIPETPSNTIEIPTILDDTKAPRLKLEKTSSIPEGTKVKKGDIITYTITVINDGNAPAHNVVINDKVPEYTTYVELKDGKYIQNTNMKTITSEAVEVLEPGEKYTITFTVIVNEIKSDNIIIQNTAGVTSDDLDNVSSNTIKIPTIKDEDKTIIKGEIPQTGRNTKLIISISIISIVLVVCAIFYIKYKKICK